MKTRAERIDYYFDEIQHQRMEFNHMRKEMEADNLDAAEIGIIVRQVDKQLLRTAEIKSENSKGKNVFYGGLILFSIGLMVTILTYSKVAVKGGTYIIAYGPVCAGAAMALKGRNMMNRHT